MGGLVQISVTIPKEDLKRIDKLRKHPQSVWPKRVEWIRHFIKQGLPKAEKEMNEDD